MVTCVLYFSAKLKHKIMSFNVFEYFEYFECFECLARHRRTLVRLPLFVGMFDHLRVQRSNNKLTRMALD